MKKIIPLILIVVVILGVGIYLKLNYNNKINNVSDTEHPTIGSSIEDSTVDIELDISNEADYIINAPMGVEQSKSNKDENETSNALSYETLENNDINTVDDTEYSEQDLVEFESRMAENVAINTYNDAIEMYKISAKTEVHNLISSGHSEFEIYTDEYIDNCTEAELSKVLNHVLEVKE